MVKKEENNKSYRERELVLVRYKLKGRDKVYESWLTRFQYNNLKVLPMIDFCEIVKSSKR